MCIISLSQSHPPVLFVPCDSVHTETIPPYGELVLPGASGKRSVKRKTRSSRGFPRTTSGMCGSAFTVVEREASGCCAEGVVPPDCVENVFAPEFVTICVCAVVAHGPSDVAEPFSSTMPRPLASFQMSLSMNSTLPSRLTNTTVDSLVAYTSPCGGTIVSSLGPHGRASAWAFGSRLDVMCKGGIWIELRNCERFSGLDDD